MAVAYNTSHDYSTNNPTLTIDGSGSDRLIMAFPTYDRGNDVALSACTLNGVAADGIFNLNGADGGITTSAPYCYWLDSNNPGAGSFSLVHTWDGSTSNQSTTIIELTGVDQTTPIQTGSRDTAQATAQANNSTITTTVAGESGQFILSWVNQADSVTQTGSGYNNASANLTERIETMVGRHRLSIGTDDSAASASEDYVWTISADGSATIDTVLAGAIAINAAGGAGGSIVPLVLQQYFLQNQ